MRFPGGPIMARSCHYRFVGIRSLVTRCRAVVLPRFGAPEVLQLRDDVDVPQLESRDVLVRTRAVSVNPLDNRMRAGVRSFDI
ncbi:hypothetical protein MLD38_000484 [Melastoma candidum]|uniref:Uncharacterized protein n=1 Tax=Melastoma candidum TaxID=119954 RepID=A0ACB9S9K3_9MYRT|nr:hypothetical protein MLD38_000484 [Melastoma candidum]